MGIREDGDGVASEGPDGDNGAPKEESFGIGGGAGVGGGISPVRPRRSLQPTYSLKPKRVS
ncbi:MAG: hypothetical protein ACE5K8_09250, partial [Candidatus Zixiibacteriota bacterium]